MLYSWVCLVPCGTGWLRPAPLPSPSTAGVWFHFSPPQHRHPSAVLKADVSLTTASRPSSRHARTTFPEARSQFWNSTQPRQRVSPSLPYKGLVQPPIPSTGGARGDRYSRHLSLPGNSARTFLAWLRSPRTGKGGKERK